jgi:hypothetical protein
MISAACHAQSPAVPALLWDCTQQYDDQYHVRCVPHRQQHVEAPLIGPEAATEVRLASVSRARDMRPVAHRGEAEVFSVQAWQVPLHALPLDAVFATELLRSVLCGRAPGCVIDYALPEVRAIGVPKASRPRSRI